MKQKIKFILHMEIKEVNDSNLGPVLVSSTVPWKVSQSRWVADDHRRCYTTPVFGYILMIRIL